jgi:tetratricopeptide (TPR) repeat protein
VAGDFEQDQRSNIIDERQASNLYRDMLMRLLDNAIYYSLLAQGQKKTQLHIASRIALGKCYSSLGQNYAFLGRNKKALQAFQRALEHFATNPWDIEITTAHILQLALATDNRELFDEYVPGYFGELPGQNYALLDCFAG